MKYAVGVQDDGMWVLGENTYVNFDCSEVPMEGSKYVWLGSIFKGPGVANDPPKILPRVIITYGACARGGGRRPGFEAKCFVLWFFPPPPPPPRARLARACSRSL